MTWLLSALSAFGRFSVMVPTRSSRSTRMVSYVFVVVVTAAAFLELQIVVDRCEVCVNVGRGHLPASDAGDHFGLRSLSTSCARMPSTRSCERSDADDTR